MNTNNTNDEEEGAELLSDIHIAGGADLSSPQAAAAASLRSLHTSNTNPNTSLIASAAAAALLGAQDNTNICSSGRTTTGAAGSLNVSLNLERFHHQPPQLHEPLLSASSSRRASFTSSCHQAINNNTPQQRQPNNNGNETNNNSINNNNAAAAADDDDDERNEHWIIGLLRSIGDWLADASTVALACLAEEIRRFSRRTRVRRVWALVRRAGHYIAYFTLLAMLTIIPYVMYGALKDQKVDLAAFNSAGVMTCGTVILSLRLVYLHLTHWYMPEVQKYVVRILWMVPLYSVHSWLSLLYHESRIYIDTIRDFYEAYVIASFVYYLIALLGGQDSLLQILLSKRDSDPNLGRHNWPFKLFLEPWELGEEFMLQCKHGVLQYVVFKITATILTYAFESVGMYCEGTFDWFVAYPYICFFQNVSVMYALYCLLMLYRAVREELQYPINWNPLGKFLCVKGVVFFCWWQSILIFWLRARGVIEHLGPDWSSEDVAYGLIDYCIVIEMVGFAIAHSYTFTYKEYLPSHIQQQTQQLMIQQGNQMIMAPGGGGEGGGGFETTSSSNYHGGLAAAFFSNHWKKFPRYDYYYYYGSIGC